MLNIKITSCVAGVETKNSVIINNKKLYYRNRFVYCFNQNQSLNLHGPIQGSHMRAFSFMQGPFVYARLLRLCKALSYMQGPFVLA